MSSRTATPSRFSKMKKWWNNLSRSMRVLLRAMGWILVFSALTSLGSWLDQRPWIESIYIGLIAGFTISIAVETRERVKSLERMVSNGVITSLVAELGKNRTIWVNDEGVTYESPPPGKQVDLR